MYQTKKKKKPANNFLETTKIESTPMNGKVYLSKEKKTEEKKKIKYPRLGRWGAKIDPDK